MDIANTPKDTIPKLGSVYSKKDLLKKLPYDNYDINNRPNTQDSTYSIHINAGDGGDGGFFNKY